MALWTGTSFSSCAIIWLITFSSPKVSIVIRERFFLTSTTVTFNASILYPLPENKPTIRARIPGSLSTITERTLLLDCLKAFIGVG